MENSLRFNKTYWNDNEPEYLLPNDTNESIRLKIQHHVLKYTWNGIDYLAPIDKQFEAGGLRILDVGCGSGEWLLNMSKKHPDCTFVGIDISMTLNKEARPTNLGFIKCNPLYGLPFPQNTFDFIYSENMFTVWKESDWPLIIEDMVRRVKRGGWIEVSKEH